MYENEELTREDIEDLFRSGSMIKEREIVLLEDKLSSYFPEDYTIDQMEEVIFKLLDDWKSSMEEGME